MGNNHDYIALDWVRGEIKQTLAQARIALETFVESKDDSTQMTFCLNHIHQVYGTLQMVEFYGAALLAEEMEKLCQSILEDQISSVQEALEVLMESLLQLENYLEHIQTGRRDLPVILLPILNDLRALQGQPLLSDTSLFTPDLSAAQLESNPEHNLRMQDPQVVANLRKLRQMFQFSLAGIIRNQDLANNFAYLYKVLARLEKFCRGTPIGYIWRVGVGYLDSIQGAPEGLSSATKQLLRDLDHQIKMMIDESSTILSKPIPSDLLKNLLYYIAQTNVSSKRIDDLKSTFSLDQALPSEQELDEERQRLQAPGQETMVSVVDALSDELNQIKDSLDLYVRGDVKDNHALSDLIPSLTQIANTLAILGLGVARKVVLEQIGKIEAIAASNEPAKEQLLMDMAGALLYVEANLVTLTDAHKGNQLEDNKQAGHEDFVVPVEQFESAHNAVIFESKNGLEQAKNGIVNFIASQWDHSEIEDVPDLLDSIRGGLQIIPLPQAAKLLEACSQYIRQVLLTEKSVPDWQQLDRLADAITSIEYYMERLSEGAQDNEQILRVAEESVAKLGFPTTQIVSNNVEPVVSLHHVSGIASESPDAVSKESDEGLIDEEILGIFVEEASEVMESIATAMAQIRSDASDQNALKELRRAFHTLKGSGRLVGANAIGELAWSVENLLNKYLDTPQALEPELIDFLDGVVERLPQLTDDFSNQRESTQFEHLIGRAEQLTEHFFADRKPDAPAEIETSTAVPKVEVEEPVVAVEESPSTEIHLSQVPEPQEDEDNDDDLIDDEILEIFIEEAAEVLETINTYLPTFLEEFDNKEALTELRRAFHTLKGSGRMVGASAIGESAWAVENLLNRVIDGSILINQDVVDLVQHTVQIIPDLVRNFENRTVPTVDFQLIERQADALSKGEFVPSLSSIEASSDSAGKEDVAESATESSVGIDSALLEIFENEAKAHVDTVEDFVGKITEASSEPVNDTISRALHTLKGSANTANIVPIASIAIPVEKFIKEMRAHNLEVTYPVAQMLVKAMELVKEGVSQLPDNAQKQLPGSENFLSSLAELQQSVMQDLPDDVGLIEAASQDPQVINIFLTEGLDILLDADSILDQWSDNPVSAATLETLISEVKTLHRGATVAGLDSIAELCDCLEECYGCIEVDKQLPSAEFLSDIKQGHDGLIDMMDQVAAGLTAVPDNKLLAELRGHVARLKGHQEAAGERQTGTVETDGLHTRLEELEKELDDALPSYSQTEEETADKASQKQAMLETSEQDGSDADHMLDPDLVDIFLEEAKEITNGMLPALEQLKDKPESENTLSQLQRDLHTLKGGARMAGVEAVGDLSGTLEKIFEQLLDRDEPPGALLLALFEDAHQALEEMLGAIEKGQTCPLRDDLIDKLNQAAQVTAQPAEAVSIRMDSGANTDTLAPEVTADTNTIDLDPELVEIFLEEAKEIIDHSGELLHQWASDTDNLELVAELQRELHTLKGGARMAEIASIGDLSHELETLFELTVESRFDVSADMISLCLACHDALAQMVDNVSEGRAAASATDLLAQIKHALKTGELSSGEQPVVPTEKETDLASAEASDVTEEEYDGDLLPLFLEESKDILAAASDCLDLWREDVDGIDGVIELQREMHTLKGGARLADIDAIGDLAEAVNRRLEQLIDGEVPDHKALFASVMVAYQEMTEMMESLIHGKAITPLPELIKDIASAGLLADAKPTDDDMSEAASKSILGDIDDVDADVIEMFVEEAGELIEALEEQISIWSKAPNSIDPNLEIQRILHTLKGGARLSHLGVLADESHNLETQLIDAMAQKIAFDGDLKRAVLAKQDVLLKLVDEIQKLSATSTAHVSEPAEDDAVSKIKTETSVPEPLKIRPTEQDKRTEDTRDRSASPPQKEESQKAAQKSAPQETIRVSAGLLEELVNLAGETSISRGRLEQQISDFGFTLEEMSATIDRLREQLRRMDMETEAQVLFSAEKEGLAGPDYSDFDPLEMDRYSSIQQLSRALTESTSDLMELRDTLSNRARDAETLLLQQSRINSELQEGLMKTRMIPFSFMVPRLRRIVRQIGGELDKPVDFDVLNAEGEMDRSVLERMVAPLEHMLRNALDHGIEPADVRQKAGKPATGRVALSLSREGGDVVLKMKDDGAGIDQKQVLKKAISQGLTPKNSQLTSHEILQFIMLPGFSTAQKITQISGRGVGMDVVASEIKQMGGSISIDSSLGQGTEFTVRLPFTVSVNRALMVNTGEDFYAIPLNTIEGIVRVSSYELEEYYKPDAPLYEYAGQKYKLQYLGKLMHSSHQPKLQGQTLPLPVILVRGTDQPMALQVDSLMGSREIVVKSLGLQFSDVHGVSGATILGDGSVVVILDLPALIRDESTGLLDSIDIEKATPVEQHQTKVVMVIDDSVTVRKVTTRLLERNGMEVITAKDGVDAIALLQDHKPDVMLLDIEMPRMDGFEVATLVRHDERLKDIPIIMITSRTGQKHKERAFAIGVNEYLGKPFQESDLLENIERVTT